MARKTKCTKCIPEAHEIKISSLVTLTASFIYKCMNSTVFPFVF